MKYTIRIEHVVKGLQDSSNETVMRWIVADDEKQYKKTIAKNLAEAQAKFNELCDAYKGEIFKLVVFNYEKNILCFSNGVLNDECK